MKQRRKIVKSTQPARALIFDTIFLLAPHVNFFIVFSQQPIDTASLNVCSGLGDQDFVAPKTMIAAPAREARLGRNSDDRSEPACQRFERSAEPSRDVGHKENDSPRRGGLRRGRNRGGGRTSLIIQFRHVINPRWPAASVARQRQLLRKDEKTPYTTGFCTA